VRRLELAPGRGGFRDERVPGFRVARRHLYPTPIRPRLELPVVAEMEPFQEGTSIQLHRRAVISRLQGFAERVDVGPQSIGVQDQAVPDAPDRIAADGAPQPVQRLGEQMTTAPPVPIGPQ